MPINTPPVAKLPLLDGIKPSLVGLNKKTPKAAGAPPLVGGIGIKTHGMPVDAKPGRNMIVPNN